MTCGICGRAKVYHGSEHPEAFAGGYLIESGCHSGVWMDDDEFAEGWAPDTMCSPCPHNPAACKPCGGSGNTSSEPNTLIECEPCSGTGWTGGNDQVPDDRYERADPDDADAAVLTEGLTPREARDEPQAVMPLTAQAESDEI